MRAKYRERLPQLDGGLFLTDGGLETTLVFHEGWDLPCFAAFVLLDSERGRKALRDYFDRYVPMAIAAGEGFILESPTWRANPDWAEKAGYGRDALARLNRAAIDLMHEIRRALRDGGFAHGRQRRHRASRRRVRSRRADEPG